MRKDKTYDGPTVGPTMVKHTKGESERVRPRRKRDDLYVNLAMAGKIKTIKHQVLYGGVSQARVHPLQVSS